MTNSLRSRMLLSASLVLLVSLGVVGVVLESAFARSAEQSVRERLLLHIYGLLAESDVMNSELFLPESMQEPGFNNLGTGLYALVYNDQHEEVWRSTSALDLQPGEALIQHFGEGLETGSQKFEVLSPGDDELFVLSYRVTWELPDVPAQVYTYVVLQDQVPFRNQVAGFRNSLWGWLLAAAVALVIFQAMIMQWGLSPLGRLAGDLEAIEGGEQEFLKGDYPAELKRLTNNLNLLIAGERAQREKYRTTLGDLAHSLKTPLAILQGAVNKLEDTENPRAQDTADTVSNQITRMNEIVSYQLERVMTRSSALIRRSVDVNDVLSRLIEAMQKVYPDSSIESRLDACEFMGDERDLMELAGNLLDNACKYGGGQVQLQAYAEDGRVVIQVSDDGAGIDQADRERVLARGERLDSRLPGQGIGLAVVSELVDRYSGEIEISESESGGAKITVRL